MRVAAATALIHSYMIMVIINGSCSLEKMAVPGNLRGPPQCHPYPQEIAGLIKKLLATIVPFFRPY